MDWETKVWGRVLHVFVSPHAAVSHLFVKSGFRCSRHLHRQRANLFAVTAGHLLIEEWTMEGLKLTGLGPGGVHVVPSGVVHRFRVIESGQLIEVYWPDVPGGVVSLGDIERLDEGGADE